MLQSRMFLGSTKHPAAWQNKATDVCQALLCAASLGNPDTMRILLVSGVDKRQLSHFFPHWLYMRGIFCPKIFFYFDFLHKILQILKIYIYNPKIFLIFWSFPKKIHFFPILKFFNYFPKTGVFPAPNMKKGY